MLSWDPKLQLTLYADIVRQLRTDFCGAPVVVWRRRASTFSAKLLTYFAEHPVFFFGYSLNDPNVKAILGDIGELVSDEAGLIPNVCQVVWHSTKPGNNHADFTSFVVEGKEYRIRAIHTAEFNWVYDALRSRSALTSINPKLLRALAARMMKLIRHDIPTGDVSVNYDILEQVAAKDEKLPSLLGITAATNPNQTHPFTLTQVAKRLGLKNWQGANKVIETILTEKGVSLKASDNRYHCKIKTGTKDSSVTHKWSHAAIDLLRLALDGTEYDVDI